MSGNHGNDHGHDHGHHNEEGQECAMVGIFFICVVVALFVIGMTS